MRKFSLNMGNYSKQLDPGEIYFRGASLLLSYVYFMQVLKVKYALWAKDWQRCLHFYRDLFDGEVTLEMEVWSEVKIENAIIGIHGGGEGKRTWTGLSIQVDDLRGYIAKMQELGGSLTSEPNDTPEDPLHLAMCMDPDGNEFMMTCPRSRG